MRMERIDKQQLAELHERHWSSAWIWFAFITAFFAAEAALAWSVAGGPVWLSVLLVLALAHLMHAHLIAFHESAHRTLCPNRWVNDTIGLFIGTLSFMPFTLYGVTHHSHHAYLASARDEELWPFVLPGTPRWLRRLMAAFELTLGILYTPFLFLRAFLRAGSPIRNRRTRRRVWIEYAVIAAFWAGVLAASALFHAWRFLIVLFVVPGVLAGNLQSLRKYVEHMGLAGSTVLSSTRSVVARGLLGRLIAFTLFDVSYHGVHHFYAGMPHARMPELESLLEPRRPHEVAPYPNYFAAFREMAGSLADPRVGAQWNAARASAPDQAAPRVAA
jgi:fatty acid desaturase